MAEIEKTNEPLVINLKTPIMVPGPNGKDMEIDKLQFPSKLCAGHIKYFPKAFVNGGSEVQPDEVVPFLSGILEIPEHYLDQIDFVDTIAIIGRLPDFLLSLGVITSPT